MISGGGWSVSSLVCPGGTEPGLMLVNLAIFMVVAARYRYKQIPHGLGRQLSIAAREQEQAPRPPHPQWARPQQVSGTSPFPRVSFPLLLLVATCLICCMASHFRWSELWDVWFLSMDEHAPHPWPCPGGACVPAMCLCACACAYAHVCACACASALVCLHWCACFPFRLLGAQIESRHACDGLGFRNS